MREFLDDAHAHRDDGYGRAQKHVRRELPKRFAGLERPEIRPRSILSIPRGIQCSNVRSAIQ